MSGKNIKNKSSKKRHLGRVKAQTKWAPFWAVLKRFGKGKRMHPSAITHVRRNWRRTKLRIKPRRAKKSHLG